MVFKSPETALRSLCKSIPTRPLEKDALERLVAKHIKDTPSKLPADAKRAQWEYALKNEIFNLATKEGDALNDKKTTYYDDLKDRLDLVLIFTEQDVCEATFPFTTLQDLLETQTIASCSHIFSWIESRAGRLTKDMVPQKGKALVLLRTLNDLLRRLSKMGSNTIFCGRILTFLSGVFPLGERSGVNLRGEYGPTWEGVAAAAGEEKSEDKEKVVEEEVKEAKKVEEKGTVKMEVDEDAGKEAKPAESKKDDFYTTFWSLQLPFSRPPLFATSQTLEEFKESVNKVLPIIKEATAKERAMTGSRAVGTSSSLKRKREPDSDSEERSSSKDYFFAKFLTSPDLLDLEIADTHFRRQFLFQLVILLHHLLTFTKTAKATWVSPRNRSLQMEFTLEPADAQWVTETIAKAQEELRQTAPGGRVFADTVATILEREKNWVRWKNDLCAPFDREPFAVEVDGQKIGLEEATREARQKMREEPPEWEYKLGSAALTEIWEMGYRDLRDLENPFQPGDVKDFAKKIKLEDARIDMRKKQLAKAAERTAAARARQAAAAAASAEAEAAAKALKAESAEESKAPTQPSSSQESASAASVPPAGSAPLHPSLPARPGTSSSSQPARAAATASTPAPAATAPVPTLAPAAAAPPPTKASTPAPAGPVVLPPDEQLNRLEENKQRLSWLALRVARDQHLAHFGKIGTGDVALLIQEIEREKEREKERGDSPAVASAAGRSDGNKDTPLDGEGDIRVALRENFNLALKLPSPSHLHIFSPHLSCLSLHHRNVLVTGGAGYIGSHVVFALQQTRRYKVICIDNYHNSYPKALLRLEKIARDALPEEASETDKESTKIDSHNCDLTDPSAIRAVFEKYGKGGIWGVIHIAAYKAVGESTEIPLTYYHNNVSATIFLLQTMSAFECTRFVYSSSATVYGTPPVVPIPETTRLKADSPYGKSKVMSETVIDDLVHAEPRRWSAISLRYFNPAGAHPSGLIGEDPRGRPGNLLPLLSQMAIGRVKDSELQVFGNDYPTPDGTCVRDYLHVLDLASGHLLALDALTPESHVFDNVPDGVRFKAYNLGRGQGYSVLQITEAMRKATNFNYKTRIVGRRRGDVPDLTADPTLAEAELGFKAKENLETMCRDLWNWQSKNPEGYGSD
ncbi:UDP-glucose 4-epimerase [Artomyces pyxidatus]|uniref:UDP-glucose 4-epimerase n=1 Tax=Artomyces pyxidatus TaxID=48021 RepID=A0ACB8TE45_9AGAM|nr:UDP-glucose 4-epimerase [Artomyces pyxidatus]